MKKLIFPVLFLALTMFSSDANAGEVYLFSQFADMKNNKANDYVNFSTKELLAGIGITTNILKEKDRLDIKAGLGKSKADVNISQNFEFLNRIYKIEKSLKYDTGMYKISTSYTYPISKDFSIQVEIEKSKNLLDRKQYMLKISYQF